MLRAFVFGLTLGIAIGPIALLILNYGVTRGFGAAALATAGSTTADFIYALIAFSAGHVFAPYLESHRVVFGIVAGIVLILIGARIVRDGVQLISRAPAVYSASVDGPFAANPLATTFVLTMLNPMTILGFAAFGAQLSLGHSWGAVIGSAVAAVSGTFTVSIGIAALGGALGPALRNTSAIGWLNIASGGAIIAFGVAGLTN